MYIRSAEPTDAERIHQVNVASCRAAYEDVLEDDAFLEMVDDDSLVEPLRTKLAETAADESLIYLVAQQDSSIVGFLQLLHHDRLPEHIDNDDAYLKSLYVHPTAWNEGIGTALLEKGLDRLPDGLDRVQLGVLSANDIGKRFYKSHNFERIDKGTFEAGEVTYETDIYAKLL